MKKIAGLTATCVVSSLSSSFSADDSDLSGKRPNILLILSDDMGFSDIGCYGSEIDTPNLDALAAKGLRFSQFYNGARCCPTRASLLTGLYAHETGIGWMSYGTYPPETNPEGYANDLNDRCVTIAQVLKTAGYQNYCVGKWHVTDNFKNNHNWPLQRGFDQYYGMLGGAGSYYDPTKLCRNNTMITPVNDSDYQPKGKYYFTEALTDNALMYLRSHHRSYTDRPFFMYLAYTAAHWPMQALEEDISRYKGKYDKGYAAIRKARFEKQKSLGIISPDTELSPPPSSWTTQPDKKWEARCMEVYAAMIHCMDRGIGEIVDELQSQGQLDNTLILFLQDNGACDEDLGRHDNQKWHLPGIKPMGPNQLQTKTWPPMRTRDGRAVLGGPNVMPGPENTYVAYGQNWANVSDTPFREYKHYVHEGGISSPLIAFWPKGIQSHGAITQQPGHIIDIMTTCADVAGATYPDGKIHPMEGISLAPVFQNQDLPNRILYWEHEGNRAVRDGRWKLVAKGWDSPWELYDISADRPEMHNLIAEYPERAAEMADLWLKYAKRTNVLPWPWGPYQSILETKK